MYYAIVKTTNETQKEIIAIFEEYRGYGNAFNFFERIRLGQFAIAKGISVKEADEKIYQKSGIKTASRRWDYTNGNKMPYAEFKNKTKDIIKIEIIEDYKPSSSEKDILTKKNNPSIDSINKTKSGDLIKFYGKERTVSPEIIENSNYFLTSFDLTTSHTKILCNDGIILCNWDCN